MCLLLMLAFVAARTIKIATENDDAMFASTILVEDGMIDLWELGFMFSI